MRRLVWGTEPCAAGDPSAWKSCGSCSVTARASAILRDTCETPRLHRRPILVRVLQRIDSVSALHQQHFAFNSNTAHLYRIHPLHGTCLPTAISTHPSQWSRYGQLSQTCAWQHPAAHTVPSTSACTHQQHGAPHRCRTPPYQGRRQRHPHRPPQMRSTVWQGRGGRLRCCSRPRAPVRRQRSPRAP